MNGTLGNDCNGFTKYGWRREYDILFAFDDIEQMAFFSSFYNPTCGGCMVLTGYGDYIRESMLCI